MPAIVPLAIAAFATGALGGAARHKHEQKEAEKKMNLQAFNKSYEQAVMSGQPEAAAHFGKLIGVNPNIASGIATRVRDTLIEEENRIRGESGLSLLERPSGIPVEVPSGPEFPGELGEISALQHALGEERYLRLRSDEVMKLQEHMRRTGRIDPSILQPQAPQPTAAPVESRAEAFRSLIAPQALEPSTLREEDLPPGAPSRPVERPVEMTAPAAPSRPMAAAPSTVPSPVEMAETQPGVFAPTVPTAPQAAPPTVPGREVTVTESGKLPFSGRTISKTVSPVGIEKQRAAGARFLRDKVFTQNVPFKRALQLATADPSIALDEQTIQQTAQSLLIEKAAGLVQKGLDPDEAYRRAATENPELLYGAPLNHCPGSSLGRKT